MKYFRIYIFLLACVSFSSCASQKTFDEDRYFFNTEKSSEIVLRTDGKISFSWSKKQFSLCGDELQCAFEYELLDEGFIFVNVPSSWVIYFQGLKVNSNGDIDWVYEDGNVFKYTRKIDKK